MRWVRGAALTIGLVGGAALAQQKPPPLDAPTPGRTFAAPSGRVDKFGEPRQLEITVRPPVPLPLGTLPAALIGGPGAAQRVLGLEATAR